MKSDLISKMRHIVGEPEEHESAALIVGARGKSVATVLSTNDTGSRSSNSHLRERRSAGRCLKYLAEFVVYLRPEFGCGVVQGRIPEINADPGKRMAKRAVLLWIIKIGNSRCSHCSGKR